MPTPRGLLSGPKFSRSHQTVIQAARPYLEVLRNCPAVSKVVVSVVRPTHAVTRRGYKTAAVDAGLKLTVRGNASVQEFYVYTSDVFAVERALKGVS